MTEKQERTAVLVVLKINEDISPATLSRLYKRVIPPSVLYESKLWNDLRQKDVKALNIFQRFISKHATNLPKQTRSNVWIIFELQSIVSEIDKRKLQYFGRLCLMDTNTLTKKIFLNRLFTYRYIFLLKHKHPDAIDLFYKCNLTMHLQKGMFPSKPEGKNVNQSITDYSLAARTDRMHSNSDLLSSDVL